LCRDATSLEMKPCRTLPKRDNSGLVLSRCPFNSFLLSSVGEGVEEVVWESCRKRLKSPCAAWELAVASGGFRRVGGRLFRPPFRLVSELSSSLTTLTRLRSCCHDKHAFFKLFKSVFHVQSLGSGSLKFKRQVFGAEPASDTSHEAQVI
jgi:hypothetical protein